MATNAGVNQYPETRPAWKTTEFWITMGVIAAGLVQQAAGVFNITDSTVAKFQFVLAAAYTLARGFAKSGIPNVPYEPDPQPTPAVEPAPVAVGGGTTFVPTVDADDDLDGDELDAAVEGVKPDTSLPPDEGDAQADNKGE